MTQMVAQKITTKVSFKVRLGSVREHEEWDAREKFRPLLIEAAKKRMDERDDDFDEFIFTLLSDSDLVESLEREEKEKVETRIKQKMEIFLPPQDKEEMRDILKSISEQTLGDNNELSDANFNNLLEDREIQEAARECKVCLKKNDFAAWNVAANSVSMLIGKAR